MGVTFEIFSLSGKIPESKDMLIIKSRGLRIYSQEVFNKEEEIQSVTQLFEGLRFF